METTTGLLRFVCFGGFFCAELVFFSFVDARDQRVQREETWNTVPMTKNSRTIDPNKIPKISKVRQTPALTFPVCHVDTDFFFF